MGRLIVVPQLPVKMRYQEWWPAEIAKQMDPYFDEVLIAGKVEPVDVENTADFTVSDLALMNEGEQISIVAALDIQETDVILHCDLSFPGLFHGIYPLLPRCRRVVFCHASAKNRLDIFAKRWWHKWAIEEAHSRYYDKVLVATQYHANKLQLPNTVVMGALPHPPASVLPPRLPQHGQRPNWACRVSRSTPQKVDEEVEAWITELSGLNIIVGTFNSWSYYYQFLDTCKFMIITAKEETYGYQVADALLRGCIPIAPNAFSYPELLPKRLLYDPSGSPEERAESILAIAAEIDDEQWFQLKCGHKARRFWDNLARELTTWS